MERCNDNGHLHIFSFTNCYIFTFGLVPVILTQLCEELKNTSSKKRFELKYHLKLTINF